MNIEKRELMGESITKIDIGLKKVILCCFRLFRIHLTDTTVDGLVQFIKFGAVGITNTAIYYITNVLTLVAVKSLEWRKDYVVGNIVGFIVSVLWSYYWNSIFVFQVEGSHRRKVLLSIVKVFLSYAFTGIILSNLISYFLIDICGWQKMIVPLINSLIGVPINFLLNKLWAFRNEIKGKENKKKEEQMVR